MLKNPEFSRTRTAEENAVDNYEKEHERRHGLYRDHNHYLLRNIQILEDNESLLIDPDGRGHNPEPVYLLVQFGTWAVTSYGLEHIDEYHYHIGFAQIVGDDGHWIKHMMEKSWVVMEDFLLAYHTCKQLFDAMKRYDVPLRELIEDKDE